jgi:hypothetical protein
MENNLRGGRFVMGSGKEMEDVPMIHHHLYFFLVSLGLCEPSPVASLIKRLSQKNTPVMLDEVRPENPRVTD